MSDQPEALKAVVRRNTLEVQSGGNFELFDELFDDDFLDHTPQPGGRQIRKEHQDRRPGGREGCRIAGGHRAGLCHLSDRVSVRRHLQPPRPRPARPRNCHHCRTDRHGQRGPAIEGAYRGWPECRVVSRRNHHADGRLCRFPGRAQRPVCRKGSLRAQVCDKAGARSMMSLLHSIAIGGAVVLTTASVHPSAWPSMRRAISMSQNGAPAASCGSRRTAPAQSSQTGLPAPRVSQSGRMARPISATKSIDSPPRARAVCM